MEIDYIIVGGGIAGLSFARFCEMQNKSFVIFDGNLRSSSKVAGGMYNPVILKRFTAVSQSEQQLRIALPMYRDLEQVLQTSFLHPMPIFRKFASIEEQNDWFTACDNRNLQPFLNPIIHQSPILRVKSKYGFGEVWESGFLDVPLFVRTYQEYLCHQNLLISEVFDYSFLQLHAETVEYKNLVARNIIFAEGYSMHSNPFFANLPLDGTKGELLLVRIPDLSLQKILKSGIFLIPYHADLYKVGATYNWMDKSDAITETGKQELLEQLEQLIDGPYEVVEHWAGVRPTVKDRRPLVGRHFQYKNVHLLNGLGTRGVLMGPFLASALLESIENDTALDANIDIARYYKKMNLKK